MSRLNICNIILNIIDAYKNIPNYYLLLSNNKH